MITGLDHITLIVTDLSVTRAFYSSLPGLSEKKRPAFDFPGLWFSAGNIQIHFILKNELTGHAGVVHKTSGRPSRHLHFAFQVDDFDLACQQIENNGAKVLDGPKNRPDGVRQLFIADPDGYVLELCEAIDIG